MENRVIKYKGMCLNGTWVYGLPCHIQTDRHSAKRGWYISNSVGVATAYAIRPETLCESIDLLDKNGREIYRGDKVSWYSKFRDTDIETPEKQGVIVYQKQGACYYIRHTDAEGRNYYKELRADYGDENGCAMTSIEIIGNIHDESPISRGKEHTS